MLSRLLHSTYGKIVLVNVYDLLTAEILGERDKRLVQTGLRYILRHLPAEATDADIMRRLKDVIHHPRARLLRLLSREQPPKNVKIATVLAYEDIVPFLHALSPIHKTDPDIANACAPLAKNRAIARVADIINQYAPRATALILGYPRNLFWATTVDAVRQVEGQIDGDQGESLAQALRDRLGLVHIGPTTSRNEARHLFLFTATVPIEHIQEEHDFAAARPTMIEGFDNKRFCQRRLPESGIPRGFGQTVHLGHQGFDCGAPEVVATAVSIGHHFTCRWIGTITTPPPGSDDAFLDFLLGKRDLVAIRKHLDTLVTVC